MRTVPAQLFPFIALFTGILAVPSASLGAPSMNLNRPYHDSLSFVEQAPVAVSFYSPEQRDFLFPSSDSLRLGVLSQKRAVSAKWKLFPNMGKKDLASGLGQAEPDGGFWITLPAADLNPGFYDCTVEVDFGESKATFLTTFGFRIEEMEKPAPPPEDFLSFWDSVKKEVESVGLNSQEGPWQEFRGDALESYLTLHAFLPKRFDPAGTRFESVSVQQVAFSGLNGFQVQANVAKPPAQGRLPAILILPGAGGWNAVRPFPLEHARHGYLAMDVSIHGVGQSPAPSGDPRRDHSDFQMVANAMQALRYLRSRPDVDPARIAVVGMSQGGRLSLVLAGLDPEIRAVIAAIPHYADLGLGSRLGEKKPLPPAAGYYDAISFAQSVRCPVFMSAGLIDKVSPPTTVYNAFRAVPVTDKIFLPMPGIGHFITFEADRRAWRWLEAILPPLSPQG